MLTGRPDHPRSRGVYRPSVPGSSTRRGSSPLARGLRGRSWACPNTAWIIPARAGFTGTRTFSPRPCRDHPRSRGVYDLWRGKLTPRRRIIPARAGFTVPAAISGRRAGDHPRSRGVYWPRWRTQCATQGSSPLARGLHRGLPGGVGALRIIPARAGFTCSPPPAGPAATDHPRSRGVYLRRHTRRPAGRGSSPLARGLQGHVPVGGGGVGIIPARAGFTIPGRLSGAGPWDHPRSRGVYAGDSPRHPPEEGSSPLARGLHMYRGARDAANRIIPARAGFTRPQGRLSGPAGDHPRSRGVYEKSTLARTVSPGSSPLARGLLIECVARHIASGIIPARAGFTARSPGRRRAGRDHPRSRGVYYLHTGRFLSGVGSSPLARGLPARRSVRHRLSGIIPARAGFTLRQLRRRRRQPDHPRSRGVYLASAAMVAGSGGSSPLARGLQGPACVGPAEAGIIPARAGFTWLGQPTLIPAGDHPRSRGVYSGAAGALSPA